MGGREKEGERDRERKERGRGEGVAEAASSEGQTEEERRLEISLPPWWEGRGDWGWAEFVVCLLKGQGTR